ncbi:MAG: hypothetical protein ACFBZ9_07570 [Sphingomonadales bacterium]
MAVIGNSVESRAQDTGSRSGLARQDPPLPAAGDKYFESKPPHHVWIVTKVYQPPSSKLPHVLLDRCGRFPASKLLSIEALMNTRFFRRDRRDTFNQPGSDAPTRRSTDKRSASR